MRALSASGQDGFDNIFGRNFCFGIPERFAFETTFTCLSPPQAQDSAYVRRSRAPAGRATGCGKSACSALAEIKTARSVKGPRKMQLDYGETSGPGLLPAFLPAKAHQNFGVFKKTLFSCIFGDISKILTGRIA